MEQGLGLGPGVDILTICDNKKPTYGLILLQSAGGSMLRGKKTLHEILKLTHNHSKKTKKLRTNSWFLSFVSTEIDDGYP